MYPLLKRVIDIVISAVGCLVLFLVLPWIATVIKLSYPGPVFFRSTRLGRNGVPFDMYKFRTMRIDAEKILEAWLDSEPAIREEYYRTFKLRHDPRITTVGKFLRKTSLDELPQFVNVLKGDMSVVGPRPVLPGELREYGSIDNVLFSVRPGITGPWQVNGRTSLPYEQRAPLNMHYIDNLSLQQDLQILLRTIPAVFRSENAE